MKKVFLLLLVLLGLCLAIFVFRPTKEVVEEQEPVIIQTALDPKLEKYMVAAVSLEVPVRQYGEIKSSIRMDNDFVSRFLYPHCEIEELDKAVSKWVNEKISFYHSQSVDCGRLGSKAELTVDYDCYLIDDHIVSVKLKGEYISPRFDQHVDIGASFNADLDSGKLLTIEDLCLPDGFEKFTNMLIEKSGIYSDQVEEDLLYHWFLTPDGLEVTFLRSDYRSMSAGSETFLFSYESLEEIIALPEYIPQPELQQPVESPEPLVLTERGNLDPRKAMLALTFDDGPSEYTDKLLDILSENGGKATFFVVGNMIDGREETLKRISNNGHEIGAHGWDHRQLTGLSSEEITSQIMSTRSAIYKATGTDTRIMRPPYGSYDDQVRNVSAQLGISLFNWSVDSRDWMNYDFRAINSTINSNIKNGSIILCHELNDETIKAMEQLIPSLIEKGYQLVTVSELFTHNGGSLSAGTVYTNR